MRTLGLAISVAFSVLCIGVGIVAEVVSLTPQSRPSQALTISTAGPYAPPYPVGIVAGAVLIGAGAVALAVAMAAEAVLDRSEDDSDIRTDKD